MQFSTNIDGFEQKDSQGFENSYNSYEQYPLEKFFIFTIYQNYTLALNLKYLKLTKMDITRFAMKLLIYLYILCDTILKSHFDKSWTFWEMYDDNVICSI